MSAGAIAAGNASVKITAENDGLKKKLAESRLALNSFAKQAATKLGPAGGAMNAGAAGGAGIMGGVAAAGGVMAIQSLTTYVGMLSDELERAVRESDRLGAAFAKLQDKRFKKQDKAIDNDDSGKAFAAALKEVDQQTGQSETSLNRYKKELDKVVETYGTYRQIVSEAMPLSGDIAKEERLKAIAAAEKNVETARATYDKNKDRRDDLQGKATDLVDGYIRALNDEQDAINNLEPGYKELNNLRRYGAKQDDIDRLKAKIEETDKVKKLSKAYDDLQNSLKGVDTATADMVRDTKALLAGEDSGITAFRKQIDDVQKQFAETGTPADSFLAAQAEGSMNASKQALMERYAAQQQMNLKTLADKMPEFGSLGGQTAAGLWQKMGPGGGDKTTEEMKKANDKLQEQIDILKKITPLAVQP